jgi:hypothetical protein
MSTAEAIATKLSGGCAYLSGGWWRALCPVHGSTGATLALWDGPRGLISYCHGGCPADQVVSKLRRLGLLDADSGPVSLPDPEEIERQRRAAGRRRQQRIAAALDYWRHETVPAPGTAVERYWYERVPSDAPIPPTIRASRGWLRHPSGGGRPAMIGLVQHVEHGPVAIHRTWLQTDGLAKASFRDPKMSLGPVKGGAVRLAKAGATLLVAEGIETAASGMVATGLPAWAALFAGGTEALILPPLPIAETVIILADNDLSGRGEEAARNAARRWIAEGRRVQIAMPPDPGTDFNDVLLGRTHSQTVEALDVAA